MRAPCLMTSISSADLIMRWRMASWATSTRAVRRRTRPAIFFAVSPGEEVILDAEPGGLDAALAQRFLQAEVEVVPAPVGVDDVLAVRCAPRHAGVDVRGDGDGVVRGDHQGVVAAERGEEEVGVVLDAVVAGQDDGIQALRGHDLAEAAQAALKLGVGERELALCAVVQDLEALELGDGRGSIGGGHGCTFR